MSLILDDLRARFPEAANDILYEPRPGCWSCDGTGINNDSPDFPCACVALSPEELERVDAALKTILISVSETLDEFMAREFSARHN